MIATAQGPSVAPVTVAGKLFAVLMAYVSVGSVVAALGFFFGPFFGQLWHLGVKWLEEEARFPLTNPEEWARRREDCVDDAGSAWYPSQVFFSFHSPRWRSRHRGAARCSAVFSF